MGWECTKKAQVRRVRVKSNWTEMDMANIGNKRMERKIWRQGKTEVKWEKCSFEGWRKDQRSSGLESTKRRSKYVSLLDLSCMILLHKILIIHTPASFY